MNKIWLLIIGTTGILLTAWIIDQYKHELYQVTNWIEKKLR